MQEHKTSSPPQHNPRDWRRFVTQHPRLTSWLILAVGMVAMVIYASRDVGLLPHQLATLIVATILLAGVCVWIINWE